MASGFKHGSRYLIASVLALMAMGVAWLVPPLGGGESSALLALAAVVISTGTCGWRAGLLTTSVCAIGHVVILIVSGGDLMPESVRLTVFLSLSLLVLTMAVLRQDAEDSLLRSETQLRAILENSLDPIGVSVAGVHRFVNPAYVRMFGYASTDDLVGEPVLKVIAPDERPAVLRRIEKRMRGGARQESYETRGLCADGRQIDMEVHVSTYELHGTLFMMVILRDVTERRRAFAEKEGLIRELRDALTKVKTLSGLLPTCAGCRKIRDESGQWQEMETYICEHSEAGFSHGLCPDCAERLYPEVFGPTGTAAVDVRR
ncbi:MAG TPA: hypothetical protein DCY13_17620 [Verrucomicrobiales bacterium]|nr:hypothetical protein [Verrucomicrobiales bacterium]